MHLHEQFLSSTLPAPFTWLNPPTKFQTGDGLEIWTDPATDFWQRTHYGFRPDNGHACVVDITGDFTISTHVTFQPQHQYDQCGLFVRADADNWIKAGAEYENETISRLGAVVTNLGYSDWSTQDINSTQTELWHRLSRQGDDFLIESSMDGQAWTQLRITHMHQIGAELAVGVYACSPLGRDFHCKFLFVSISENQWFPPR